ncbi:MAG: 2Fe-2S iron-sulfur cluster binding domain-containing protein [Candidatus Eremiobacteraeota bacterium]|nr:2Fe-2S iron-sulfur cluster binding domain-containing protein [Candidatus Eremiobacteraeota bacterium]
MSVPRKLNRRRFIVRAVAPTLLSGTSLRVKVAAATLGDRGPGPTPVTLNVNGAEHTLNIEPRVTLLDALRERLDLTGTKKGCDQGTCGACTVLVNGRRVNACLTLAVMTEGKFVTTIEGLGSPTSMHPMQKAFLASDAFQCGYCTPGQIVSAVGLLHETRPTADENAVRTWMSGNICRCGAYPNIVDAIRKVARST